MNWIVLLCFIISGSFAIAKTNLIDIHYHHDFDAGNLFFDQVNKKNNFFHRDTTIMIDSAYNLRIVRINSDRVNPEKITEAEIHKKISDDISSRKNIYGLCGIDLDTDYKKHLADCLQLPKMIGVKIHLHANETRLSDKACSYCQSKLSSGHFVDLEKVAAQVAKIDGVILIHFIHFSHYVQKVWQSRSMFGLGEQVEVDEADALLEVAKKYPNVKFIIAHGGVDSSLHPKNALKLVKSLSALKKPVRNIYLDTSAIPSHAYKLVPCFQTNIPMSVFYDEEILPIKNKDQCKMELKSFVNSKDSREVIALWKKIGIDRILFGSDGPSPAFTIESIQFIQSHPDLSTSDKEKIFSKNARLMIDEILLKKTP